MMQLFIRKHGHENCRCSCSEKNAAECIDLQKGNIYYDTSNVSAHVLGYAKNYLGAEKLMFGSDYPFVEPDVLSDLIETVFTKEEQEDIFWKKANEIYQLNL